MADLMAMVRRWLGRDLDPNVDRGDPEEHIGTAHRLADQKRRLLAIDKRIDQERRGR